MHQQNRIRMREQLKVFQRIILTIVILALVMLGVMIFGSMDDEVSGDGVVEGIREYKLKTLVSAKVTRVLRHEGEEVMPGEALLEFDARNQQDEIIRLKNAVRELELTISVKEKVRLEGKKRPVMQDVDYTFPMDGVKYTKYLISFK